MQCFKVMDRIQPGVVVWKRVNTAPKNRFKKVENGNYVIDIAKVHRLSRQGRIRLTLKTYPFRDVFFCLFMLIYTFVYFGTSPKNLKYKSY